MSTNSVAPNVPQDYHIQIPDVPHPLSLPANTPKDYADKMAGHLYDIWHGGVDQAKDALYATSESLGGPSNGDVSGYIDRSKQALSHPVDSLKQVGKSLAGTVTGFSDPNLLSAAHQAWSEGTPEGKVEAATHVANYLLGPVGKVNEQAASDLKNKNYARAVGHMAPILAGALFGGETAPTMTEADAATQAANASTISTRTPAGVSAPRLAAKAQFAKGGEINPSIPVQSTPTNASEVTASAPSAPAVKAPAPLTAAERAAISTIRKQYAGEPTPLVKGAEPNVGAHIIRGSEAEQAIHDFTQKAYPGIGEKPSGVEQVSTPGEVGVHEINIGGKTLGTGTPAQTAAEAVKQDALIRGYISKLEANTTGSDIDQLAAIKQRLGIKSTKPSAEASQTKGVQPTADDLANLKSKLSGKASSYPYSKTEGDLSIAHRVQALDANNNSLGYVSALEDTSEPHTWRIDQADMGANAGKGFGTKAYTRLASEAAKQGKSLKSGGVVSDSAAGVWDKLKAAGLNVIETKTKAGRTFEIPAPSAVEDVPKSASTGKSQSMTADLVSKAPAGRIQQALSSNDRAFARHLPETEDISGDWSKYVKGLANERQ
jgi:hypothetical protein